MRYKEMYGAGAATLCFTSYSLYQENVTIL